MARHNNAARLGEEMSSEESALMDADRTNTAPVIKQPDPVPAPQPEPVVEPVKQPEPAAQVQAPVQEPVAEQPEIDPQTGKRRMVDYGALHEERERRRATEKERNEAKEQLAKLTGRFETLAQLAQAQQQQPNAQQPQNQQPEPQIVIPDIANDPVGHFQAQLLIERREREALTKRLEETANWRQQQEQTAQATNNVQRLAQIAIQHEQEFSKVQPEYQKAALYVRDMRDAELKAMGYADPAQRAQMIQVDALNIAAQALNNNMSAAEVVWAIAQARGFKTAPAAPAPEAPAPVQTPAPVAPAAPAQNIGAEKLKTVSKGQETGQSIGQVNGAPPPQESLPERLLAMSDEDFEAATKGDKWRQLFN